MFLKCWCFTNYTTPKKLNRVFCISAMDVEAGGPHLRPKVHFHESGPTWTEKRCIKHLEEKNIWNWFQYDKRKCTKMFLAANNYIILVGGWGTHLKEYAGSSNWIISPILGVKIKNIWNHHPEIDFCIIFNITSTQLFTMATETYANSDLGVVPWCKHVIGVLLWTTDAEKVCGKNMLIYVSPHIFLNNMFLYHEGNSQLPVTYFQMCWFSPKICSNYSGCNPEKKETLPIYGNGDVLSHY